MREDMIPLASKYFHWLYAIVFPMRGVRPYREYLVVCEMMHDMPFQVIVPRDGNRVADGAQLRNSFLRLIGGEPLDEAELLMPDASVLEVLVALSLKAQHLIEISPHEIFMQFLENLSIDDCFDGSPVTGIRLKIARKLRRFNNRKYTPRGHGGLFPLNRTDVDQRKVELWYQMGAYMNERQMY